MLSEKEKLEDELRFLKESYDIGVITDEEYENGRKRIEAKIKHIIEKENQGDGLFKEDFFQSKKDDEKIKEAIAEGDKQEKPKVLEDDNEEAKKGKKAVTRP